MGTHVGVGVQALVGAERAAGDGAEQRGALAAGACVICKRIAGQVALLCDSMLLDLSSWHASIHFHNMQHP